MIADDSVRIFVANLDFGVDRDQLRELAAQFGQVTGTYVIRDRVTGLSKGSGFIEAATAEDAAKILAAVNGYNHSGRVLRAEPALPRGF